MATNNANQHRMQNPFEYPAPKGWPVNTVIACVVEDQLRIVRAANADQLRAILAWPFSGCTVRKAAASRLRRLSDQAHLRVGGKKA